MSSSSSSLVSTGIFKEPVDGRVMLRTLNLDGDQQVDLKGHGGIYKAACVYPIENYDHWKRELERDDFRVPQFGENFTVEGMAEDRVHVGDVFRLGDAVVEVTQPRVPCYRLGIKMNDPRFPKLFLQSCRVGFYFRVLEEGEVGAGDDILLVREGPEGMTVRDVCHLILLRPAESGGHPASRLDPGAVTWVASRWKREKTKKTTCAVIRQTRIREPT